MTTSESKGRFFLLNESIRIDSNRELECSSIGLSDVRTVPPIKSERRLLIPLAVMGWALVTCSVLLK